MATEPQSCCAVIELRQYTLHPGKRDELIELFDRAFVESQEATGLTVIAQFRDLDRPDRFVWLRGFPDMDSRARSLQAFYTGPVWRRHSQQANATMIDSDNVLLLRPAGEETGFAIGDAMRVPIGETSERHERMSATIYSFDLPVNADFVTYFDSRVLPVLERAGAKVIARLVTENAPNTFPRLPVREGEHVFVWFAAFTDEAAERAFRERLSDDPEWNAIADDLAHKTVTRETLRLSPTARSRLPARD